MLPEDLCCIDRTSYANEEASQRMISEIQTMVKPVPENLKPRRPLKDRVLARHNLLLMDDQSQFDGATPHEIRDHWRNEGHDELNSCAETLCFFSGLFGARYNFCLFVDDICLESLNHMGLPVVKILRRDFGHLEPEKRWYTIYPGFEDGRTAEHYQDVGWMYMDVLSYPEFYAYFSKEHTYWYDQYSRPPDMVFGFETPGFWSK
ncbi:hypothetical protein BDDG_02911 [Blastomyces dermatitidis ATCC 18188]|uniref:Uncharacterized protein n=1 Tax=Ajellomyces dermatitidis (strain ATCC 18188 / CBS 674.68) TaxID=653446 RepID=F2T9Q7_AJEDA|nr:hypothetical protein BDDG_02911 [Blastomyces dermatitidis ATCC 18188]